MVSRVQQWSSGQHPNTPTVALQVLVKLLIVLGFAAVTRAGNIFDDDWLPAARPITQPAPVSPAPADTTRAATRLISPKPPTSLPTPSLSRASTPSVLRSVPTGAQQAKVRTLFKVVYSKELTDRSPAARREFASRLIDAATKSIDAPVDQFVLLMGARQAAVEALDLQDATKAADALAGAYDVDVLKLKLDSALKAAGKADSAAASGDNCRAGLEVMNQLVAADDYVAALRVGTVLKATASADPVFSLILLQRLKDIEALRSSRERIARDFDALKSAPRDEKASAAVGGFLCYLKGDWERGLPLLAKGSDPAVRKLADAELAVPVERDALAQLGDGWWDLAETQPETSRGGIRRHAASIYARAVIGSTGLEKAAMEKRMLQAAGLRCVDLLAQANPESGAIQGFWKRSDGGLLSDSSFARFEFPYRPPSEYLVRVEFTRVSGNDSIDISVGKANGSVCWTVGGWNNTICTMHAIQGFPGDANPTSTKSKEWLRNGRRAVTIFEVREGLIRGFLDGQLISQRKTDWHDMIDPHPEIPPRDVLRVGVLSWGSPTVFHRVEVLELSGQGESLP